MKTLYESILKSTHSGLDSIVEDIKSWLGNFIGFKVLKYTKIIPSKLGKDTYDVYLDKKLTVRKDVTINGHYCNPELYKLGAIYWGDKLLDVNYIFSNISNADNLVKQVNKKLYLCCVKISVLDKVSKGCKTLKFSLWDGREVNVIDEIKNIEVDNFLLMACNMKVLYIDLDDIKNIKVNNVMMIDTMMLGLENVITDNLHFTEQANKKLTNFFKNNKVAVENVYMMPLFNPIMKYKLGKIHFDKYENSWIFDPIEECINTQAVDNYLKAHI